MWGHEDFLLNKLQVVLYDLHFRLGYMIKIISAVLAGAR